MKTTTTTLSATIPEDELPPREPVPTTAELLDDYVNGTGTPTYAPSLDGKRAVPVFGAAVRTVSQDEQAAQRPTPPNACEACSQTITRREYIGEEAGNPMATREVQEVRPYRYWGIWGGECPRCLVPKVLDGTVKLPKLEEIERAEGVLNVVSVRTGSSNPDDWRLLGAMWKRARYNALRAAQKDLGIEPGDHVPAGTLPTLISIEDVARWWSVDEATVRTWVRKSKLPRPYKIGGTVRFDPRAILQHIAGGHDLDLPEGPAEPAGKVRA